MHKACFVVQFRFFLKGSLEEREDLKYFSGKSRNVLALSVTVFGSFRNQSIRNTLYITTHIFKTTPAINFIIRPLVF